MKGKTGSGEAKKQWFCSKTCMCTEIQTNLVLHETCRP